MSDEKAAPLLPNLDQVTLVQKPCPDCGRHPVWILTIGGILSAEAISPHGILNFLQDYLPDFEEGIRWNLEAVERSVGLLEQLRVIQKGLEKEADEWDDNSLSDKEMN